MIRIKCDMNKITALHKKYVEEYLAPNFCLLYNQGTEMLKKYLICLLGKESTEVFKQLKILCTDRKLEELVAREQKVRVEFLDYEKASSKQMLYNNEIKTFWDKLLNYDGFGKGIKKGKYSVTWNRHLFVEMTNIRVCPYCNRNYITNYVDIQHERSIRTTASVDHYYPKAKYPFLQMNIYNMIPSCMICNSYTKGSREFKHLNPFLDDGSISFELNLTSVEDLYQKTDKNSNIRVLSGKDKKSKESIKAFKLSEIYETHGDIVGELLQRVMDYENFEEDYYLKLLGNLDIGIENIHKNWFDFLSKEENDEPLLKLKKDIYKQMTR